MESLTYYSKRYNLQFYPTTKCAMTTITRSLQFDIQLINLSELPNDVKTFCIVRDPYERSISSFCHIQRHDCTALSVRGYFKLLDEYGYFDSHCWPQYYFLNWKKGYLNDVWSSFKIENIDYFVDFKNMKEELSIITDDNIKLPHLNKWEYPAGREECDFHFGQYIDQIKKLYKNDYWLFENKLGKIC